MISATLATSSMYALNSQKQRWWILTERTDNGLVIRSPSRFCARKPKRRYLSIESWMQMLPNIIATMVCLYPKLLSSKWWKTRDQESRPWMTSPSGMQCQRGATESHCMVFQENCQLHRLRQWWSVFQSSQGWKIHSVRCSRNSGDDSFIRWASSSYGLLHWVHNMEKA